MDLRAAPFVGRLSESATLARHWAAAGDGAGRIVLVTGEAGIGKTRVVEEVIGRPGTPRVSWGRCHEGDGAPPFWPWLEVLRPVIAATPRERLRDALGFGGTELARLLPELTGLFAAADPGTASESPGSPAARFRLFDAITSLLDVIADEPLALVLDDLHWADSESLLLLRFLGPEVRHRRLLIVATCRESELREVPEAPHLRADLARLAERVALPGLTPDEIAAYACASAGVAPSPAVVRAVHDATGGNSFFVTEVVDLLRRAGRLDWPALRIDDLELPLGLRDAVLRRLDGLPPETRALLDVASLCGASVDLSVLAHAVGCDVRDTLTRLGPAFASGVLRDVPDSPGAPRFAHQLVADALRSELAPDVRRARHLELADALEAVRGPAIDEAANDVARHLLRAVPLADPARTVAALARAGERALGMLGYEDAATSFAQALDVARSNATPAATRLDLLSRLAEARLAAGDDDGARSSAVEAARQAQELGDRARLVAAAALASAARSETGQPDHEVVALLESAARASGEDAELRARVLPPLSRELYFVDRERRLACSEEGLAQARALGDASLLATALGARHLALWEPGRAAERLALTDEQLRLAERTQDAQLAMHAHAWRIADLLELGRMDEADEGLIRYEALAARLRLPRLTWHVAVAQTSRALRLGRLAEAERRADEALGTWRSGPQNNVLQFFAIQVFVLREEQGRLAELDATLQDFAARSPLPAWQAALASLHATLGRREDGRRVLHGMIARLDALPFDGTWVSTLARLAHASTLLADVDAADALAARLTPYAADHVVLGAGVAWLGPVTRALGLLELAAGRVDRAVTRLEEALVSSRACRAPAQVAHVQAALARALRARDGSGDGARAHEMATLARAAATEIGLLGLLRELDDAGFGVSPRGDASTRDVLGLTSAPAAVAAADSAPRAVTHAEPSGDSPTMSGAADSRATGVGQDAGLATLRREGDIWSVAHGAESVRLRDMKGIHYLAVLLREPGRELHALDVVGADVGADEGVGAALDPQLRRAHRERLMDLRAELTDAEECNDVGRAEMLRLEIEEHVAELADELGRMAAAGGGQRRAGSIAERARLNVTRALRKAIDRITADCPRLGHHLSHSIQTGRVCTYREDPTYPVRWRIEDGSPSEK
jgi:hypothetical protein